MKNIYIHFGGVESCEVEEGSIDSSFLDSSVAGGEDFDSCTVISGPADVLEDGLIICETGKVNKDELHTVYYCNVLNVYFLRLTGKHKNML